MAFTQPATFNEEWSDARVLSHLQHIAPQGENAAFSILYTAYKHMRPADFERFLPAFIAAGYDVHARNAAGQTFVEYVQPHARQSAPFIALIQRIAA